MIWVGVVTCDPASGKSIVEKVKVNFSLLHLLRLEPGWLAGWPTFATWIPGSGCHSASLSDVRNSSESGRGSGTGVSTAWPLT